MASSAFASAGRPKPASFITVAQRRLRDAEVLLEQSRSNGAIYLAGFVIECDLKGTLLKNHGWLASTKRGSDKAKELSKPDKHRLKLFWSHDLAGLWAELVSVHPAVFAEAGGAGSRFAMTIEPFIRNWTILARYSPSRVDKAYAFATVQATKTFHRAISRIS